MGFLLKLFNQLGRVFVGIPASICATVVLGSVGFFAWAVAASGDEYIKTAFGKKEVHTEPIAESIKDAFVGAIGWCWRQSLPIVFDNAATLGAIAAGRRSLDRLGGKQPTSKERTERDLRASEKRLKSAENAHSKAKAEAEKEKVSSVTKKPNNVPSLFSSNNKIPDSTVKNPDGNGVKVGPKGRGIN